jgi:hypothetical protein
VAEMELQERPCLLVSCFCINNERWEMTGMSPYLAILTDFFPLIQEIVTTASTYLFEATQKRFFFKNVSVLIPESWEDSLQYKRPTYESYTHVSCQHHL